MPETKLKHKRPNQSKDGLSKAYSFIGGMCLQEADNEQDYGHDKSAPNVYGAPAQIWHQDKPVHQSTEKCECSSSNVKLVCLRRRETDLLEEVGRVVSEDQSREYLS